MIATPRDVAAAWRPQGDAALMLASSREWSWPEALARAGVRRDRRFNAGTMACTGRLYWDAAGGASHTVTGREFELLVRRVATTLHRIGVRPSDRVAGFLGRCPEAFAAPLATWRLGAVYVPLFTSLGIDALRIRLEDSGAAFGITNAANRDALGAAQGDLRVMVVDGAGAGDAPLGEASAVEAVETHAEDAATIVYTSGTTSRPKGCVMPHRAVVTLWPYVTHCLDLNEGDVFFSTADPGWTFGLMTTGLAPLSLGYSRLLYEPGFDAVGWWSAMERWGATHLASAPTGFRQLAAAGETLLDGRRLCLCAATSAGESLTPEVVRWFRENLGLSIHDSYGLTELGMVTANLRSPGAPEAAEGSMGFALPGFAVRVIDENGKPVESEGLGRIAVRDDGQLLSTTYWGRDDEWRERLQDGWWWTEDLARVDHGGRFWYVARRDDMIVTAGYNVSPAEVEAVLLDHPLVLEVGCVGEADERKGQVIAAHVVLRGNQSPDLLDELRRLVGSRLGWHAAPRKLYVVEQLPRTDSGKVRRQDLRRKAQ